MIIVYDSVIYTVPLFIVCIKKRNIFSRIEKANGANKNEKNSTYYNEIRPALVILRILGRFPYRMTKSGSIMLDRLPTSYVFFFFDFS